MIEITDFNDTLITNVPTIEKIKGHQLNEYNFIWFGRFNHENAWRWYRIEFDFPIVDGKAIPPAEGAYHSYLKPVDPDGFIFDGEIYCIKSDTFGA